MIRSLLLLASCALCLPAASQELLGTKADPGSGSSFTPSGPGIGSLFNVLLALGIVYGLLRFAMPKVMARMNKRLVTGSGSAIRIEESASFAGGSLYVVSARGKTLLLAVGSQGVQSLADLTDDQPKPEPETFGEIVQRELGNPLLAVVADRASQTDRSGPTVNQSPTPNPESEWKVALERLERLAN